jgi:hypothetical protein
VSEDEEENEPEASLRAPVHVEFPEVNEGDPTVGLQSSAVDFEQWRSFIEAKNERVPFSKLKWDKEGKYGQLRGIDNVSVEYYRQQLMTGGPPLKAFDNVIGKRLSGMLTTMSSLILHLSLPHRWIYHDPWWAAFHWRPVQNEELYVDQGESSC